MRKNTSLFVVSFLLALSITGNLYLLNKYVEGSYLSDFNSRLMQDTKILSSLIDKEITSEKLQDRILQSLPKSKIDQMENKKSLWDLEDRIYPSAIVVSDGIIFYFDTNKKLIRIDHWLNDNSPLYEIKH